MPSPQGLSIGGWKRSSTSTSSPRSRAASAVASPAGPPPRISVSTLSRHRCAHRGSRSARRHQRAPSGHRAVVVGVAAQRLFLGRDPRAQDQSVGRAPHQRGDPRGVDQRQRRDLDDHRQVVGMAQPAVGTAGHHRQPRDHQDLRGPALAQGRDRPVAQRHRSARAAPASACRAAGGTDDRARSPRPGRRSGTRRGWRPSTGSDRGRARARRARAPRRGCGA